MSASERRQLLDLIVSHFEAVGRQIEQTIEALAEDDSGTVDLAALHRAKALAEKGATMAREAGSGGVRAPD